MRKEESKIRQMALTLSKMAVQNINLLREISDLLDINEEDDIEEKLENGMINKAQRRIYDLQLSIKNIEEGIMMIFRYSLPIMAHEEEEKNE